MAETSEALKGTPAEASALFKDVQERLGLIRDVYVLSAWLGRQAEAARSRGREALAAEAAAQRDWFLERSRTHHREFLEADVAATVTRGLEALGASAASFPERPPGRLECK